jgi:hypothetical protein
MCLQLFLNGDNNTRGTHISLFFVLMQGNYDANLQWPFKFKVTFTFINQLTPENNHSVSFWPDMSSSSFQRPNTEMNIPYGISKGFPLDVFNQNEDQFVQDDTMFVKVAVDFLAELPGKTPVLNNLFILFYLEITLNDDAGELLNDNERVNTTDDNLPLIACRSDLLS